MSRRTCPGKLLVECDFAGVAIASARVALEQAVQDALDAAQAALLEGAVVADVSRRVGLSRPTLYERCSW